KTPRAGLPFSSRRHPELKLSCWTGRPQRRVHLHNRWSLPPAPSPELTPPRYTPPLQLRNTICQTTLSLSLSLSHTRRHTHTRSLSHTHTHTRTDTHTHAHTHKHTHLCKYKHSLMLSLSLSHDYMGCIYRERVVFLCVVHSLVAGLNTRRC